MPIVTLHRIRNLILLLLTLLGTAGQAACYGATTDRDSLLHVLGKTTDPQRRVDLLLQLSQSYMLESSAEVGRYALRALTLSDSLNDAEGAVKSLTNLTWSARIAGDYAQALDYASQCLARAEQIKNTEGIANAHYEMGAVYHAQKDYKQSRAMFNKARREYETMNDAYGIGKSYNGIGETYRMERSWASALTHYDKAEKYFQDMAHRKGLILLKNNRGHVFAGQFQYEKALQTLKEAHEEAVAENFTPLILESSIAIANVLKEEGESEQAAEVAERALEMADSLNLPRNVFDAAEALYQISLIREDYPAALRYQRMMYEAEARMRTEEVDFRLSILDFDLKMKEKEGEIEGLQKDKRIKSLWQWVLGLLLSIAMITFGFLAYAYRKNQRTTRLLASQNELLAELNREKDSLMNIVAHDLKSPLSKVKGLAELTSLSGPLGPKQLEFLGLMDKVVTDGERLIQDLLDISLAESVGDNLKVHEGELCSLVDGWLGHHRENAAKKNIDLHFTCGKAEIPIKTEITYVSRIFDNLLSNAIKYSPPGKQVQVKIWADSEKMFLIVKDQGPGISKEDQAKMFKKFQRLSAVPTAGESSTGLGLSIIKTLAQRLDGEVQLESALGEGATFTVSLPLVVERKSKL